MTMESFVKLPLALPTELLDMIVEHVDDPDYLTYRKTLHTLLFVSCAFRDFVLPKLYNSLKQICGADMILTLAKTLRENPSLASLVCDAEITFGLEHEHEAPAPPTLPKCSYLTLHSTDAVQAREAGSFRAFEGPKLWIFACPVLKRLMMSKWFSNVASYHSLAHLVEIQINGNSIEHTIEETTTILSISDETLVQIDAKASRSDQVVPNALPNPGKHSTITFLGRTNRSDSVSHYRNLLPDGLRVMISRSQKGFLGNYQDVMGLGAIVAFTPGCEQVADVSMQILATAVEVGFPNLRFICLVVKRGEQVVRVADRGLQAVCKRRDVVVFSKQPVAESQARKQEQCEDPFLTDEEAAQHGHLPLYF